MNVPRVSREGSGFGKESVDLEGGKERWPAMQGTLAATGMARDGVHQAQPALEAFPLTRAS